MKTRKPRAVTPPADATEPSQLPVPVAVVEVLTTPALSDAAAE
jgi:hypothetical protein